MKHANKSSSGSNARSWLVASCAAIVCCSLTITACHHEAPLEPASLPNVSVIDDHGRSVSLGSLKGKVVLLDFIHVGCPGICTTLVSKFGEVADSLKPELGSKVVLLSVTNDPEHDRPEQLLALARQSDADLDGWLFVTGKPTDVERVIKAFGVKNERLPDGSPAHISQVFLLGADGQKKREYQGMLMQPQTVVSQIREAMPPVHGGAS
jgi:protein SCO1